MESCRGYRWRARAPSTGTSGQSRLVSEVEISALHSPLPPPSATPAAATNSEHDVGAAPGSVYPWEVLACVGFPLPKKFRVSSSLGGLGGFRLSRQAHHPHLCCGRLMPRSRLVNVSHLRARLQRRLDIQCRLDMHRRRSVLVCSHHFNRI